MVLSFSLKRKVHRPPLRAAVPGLFRAFGFGARFARFGVKVFGLDPAGKTEAELALAAIEATEDCFRSLNMPVSFSELSCGVVSEEQVRDLAWRCTYYGSRTIGTFRVLDADAMRVIYTNANVKEEQL